MTRSEPAEYLDPAQEWALRERKIRPETLDELGVITGEQHEFPDLGDRANAIVFPYPNDAWKARAIPEEAFATSPGLAPAIWNLPRVVEALAHSRVERVHIVQGDLNACALVEAGVSADTVVSLPAGMKTAPADAEDRYGFIREAIDGGLGKAKIVWCGNSDPEGRALRADMVRLFRAAKFSFVDWPDGVLDAGEYLIQAGREQLLRHVREGVRPWPVDGLYRLSALPEPPPLTLWSPGFAEWEKKLFLAPQTLSVVTGHPGMGKTSLWVQIWFQILRAYDIRLASASFETRPKPHLRRQLRSLYHGALEKHLDRTQRAEADDWIDDRYRFLVHPTGQPTLEWLLDVAEVAVVRDGVRVIQIDPWNRLESAWNARAESETQYIGRCLRTLHTFASDLNCHVQILAHPAKMDANRRGTAPLLEDISGSKNWDNAVDQGFVVHRDELFRDGQRQTAATLYCRKSRFEELGYPCAFELDFDLSKGAYRSVDYDQRPVSSKPRKAK